MPVTYAKASMTLVDTTALSEANVASSNNQAFGNLDRFKALDDTADYMNPGLNYSVLDGSKVEMPDNITDVAFMSNAVSGAEGSFSTAPKITISFAQNHTSPGLTLYFVGDYPRELRITYYDQTGTWIAGFTYYPDALTYYCKGHVENYYELIIEFPATRLPKQYAQLRFVMYGTVLDWEDAQIKTAKVIEEIDESFASIPIGTASMTLVDEDEQFNVTNTDGAWKDLQINQQTTISECKDDSIIDFGAFYLKSWSFSQNLVTFQFQDAIGLLDLSNFYDGTIYHDEPAGNIIDAIMSAAQITAYSVDAEIKNIKLSGYLKIQKCRSALKEVCAAVGVVADRTRTGAIRIRKPLQHISSYISPKRKFSGKTKVAYDTYVSGIKITTSTYALDDNESQAFTGTLSAGTHRVEFSAPFGSGLTMAGGTIVEEHTNYAIVSVNTAGSCEIRGHQYQETQSSIAYVKTETEHGETGSIKQYTFALVNATLLESIGRQLLNYYDLRQKVDITYLIDSEKVGSWAGIQDVNGYIASTLIYKQTIDLTGGFIAQASCRGYNRVLREPYYMPEIKADGNVLI